MHPKTKIDHVLCYFKKNTIFWKNNKHPETKCLKKLKNDIKISVGQEVL